MILHIQKKLFFIYNLNFLYNMSNKFVGLISILTNLKFVKYKIVGKF